MAKQTINTSTPNSGKGDSLFSAFTKINANFTELYDDLAGIDIPNVTDFVISTTVPTSSAGSEGDKQGMVAFDNSYFYYCISDFDSSTIIWKRVAWSNDVW
jgi:hypothetical protein